MANERRIRGVTPLRKQQPPRGGRWVGFALLLTGCALIPFYMPFARLFGFESFEARHGGGLFDFGIFIVLWSIGKALYLYVFRRRESAAELAAAKDAVAHGRMKRMSLAARWLFIVCTLALVILAWTAPEPHRTHILTISVPLFLLFCAVELNFIVHPGETLLPDPRDELLAFFRARMLQAGYIVAIAALAVLYLIDLVAPKSVGLLLPLVLAACLLVPSLVYKRLDRQAESDG